MQEIYIPPIYQRSTEIDDLIGNTPGWILYSGISVFGLIVLLLIAVAAFISYPDKIIEKGIILGNNPPIEHLNLIDGLIDSVYFKDKDEVILGDTLIYLESQCNLEHLKQWQSFMTEYRIVKDLPDYLKIKFPVDLQLGELQVVYSQMQLAFESFQYTLRQLGNVQRINTLEKAIEFNNQLKQFLDNEKEFMEENLHIIEKKDDDKNKMLQWQELVSQQDEDRSMIVMKSRRNDNNKAFQDLIKLNIQSLKFQLEIDQLIEERNFRINNYRIKIQEMVDISTQSIKEWEEQYYIKAKTSGILQINNYMIKGRRIFADEIIANVITNLKDDKYLFVQHQTEFSDRIFPGMKAFVRFDVLPQKEYSIYKGKVGSISITPEKGISDLTTYNIFIPLPDSIIAKLGIEMPFIVSTKVRVDFISNDRSVLHRILKTFLN